MPEVYTCKCGHQRWIIFGGEIECAKCEQRYYLWPKSPQAFNCEKEANVVCDPATAS